MLMLKILLLTLNGYTKAFCPNAFLSSLSFVVEYAVWRGWSQVVIFGPWMSQDCQWAAMRLQKCLNLNGIGAAISDVSGTILIPEQKLGIVLFTPLIITDDISEQLVDNLNTLFEAKANTATYDWLVVSLSSSENEFVKLNKVFNSTAFRFDQNLLVSFPYLRSPRTLNLCDHNFENKAKEENGKNNNKNMSQYQNKSTCISNVNQYYKATERYKHLIKDTSYRKDGALLPLQRSGLYYYSSSLSAEPFLMINLSNARETAREKGFDFIFRNGSKSGQQEKGIHLVQYFKVKSFSTLYGAYLGKWSQVKSMSEVKYPYPVEARNFLNEELLVGGTNFTDDAGSQSNEDSSKFLIENIFKFLIRKLNATNGFRYYPNIGYRSFDGVWTGLLGALMESSVDLVMDPVTAHPSLQDDMDFLFPLAETMCNIYMRHQETSSARDIFLSPFSWKLIIAVMAMAIVFAAAILLISRVTPGLKEQPRTIDFTEGLIWSAGIFCQQGNNWIPSSPSATMVLITCLGFSIIIFNSYSAFITSVLSVRVASVDTVAAVLYSSNFKIGYIKNGPDQMYLMSTKDPQLNEYYIRGYSDYGNLVSSAEEGLVRAAKSDYAFFANQRSARPTLHSLSQERGRCSLREVPVPSTKTFLAFPLQKNSPFARPALISLLRLRSGGSLERLAAALVPPMPHCDSDSGFASARVADVRSALLLILIGLVSSLCLGVNPSAVQCKEGPRPGGTAYMITVSPTPGIAEYVWKAKCSKNLNLEVLNK